MIKLLVLDVDGVLTDGRKHYDKNGNVVSKVFCDKDWTAIKCFVSCGVKVVFLSGDIWNASIAQNRNIPFYLSRGQDKGKMIQEIAESYRYLQDEVAYVGDDIFDLSAIMWAALGYCPRDAPFFVREKSIVLGRNGGDNVISFLFDRMVGTGIITYSMSDLMDGVNSLDKKEVF